MKKPTQAQLETLRAISAGNVRMVNTGYSSFRIQGATPQVVGRLVSLKWARWPKGPVGEQTCELTPEGKVILQDANAP